MTTFVRFVILIVAVSLFAFGVVLAFKGNTPGAFAIFGAGVMALIFVFLTQFKKFKGFGIEAEMWEQKMEQAEAIINNLQSLALAVSEPILTVAARLGRVGSHLSRRDRYEMMRRIEKVLKENGVPEDKVEEAKSDYHRYNLFDLSRPLAKVIEATLDAKVNELREAVESFGSTISAENIEPHRAAAEEYRRAGQWVKNLMEVFKLSRIEEVPDTVEKLIGECDLLDEGEKAKLLDDVSECLKDVRYYIENREFRRPDAYFAEEKEA